MWRLERPVRGMVAGFAVLVLASALVGFGMGLVELAVVLLVATAAALSAARDGRARSGPDLSPGAETTGPPMA